MGVAGRKNKVPAMKMVSLRIPQEAFDYFNSFPSYSVAMRKVLMAEVEKMLAKPE